MKYSLAFVALTFVSVANAYKFKTLNTKQFKIKTTLDARRTLSHEGGRISPSDPSIATPCLTASDCMTDGCFTKVLSMSSDPNCNAIFVDPLEFLDPSGSDGQSAGFIALAVEANVTLEDRQSICNAFNDHGYFEECAIDYPADTVARLLGTEPGCEQMALGFSQLMHEAAVGEPEPETCEGDHIEPESEPSAEDIAKATAMNVAFASFDDATMAALMAIFEEYMAFFTADEVQVLTDNSITAFSILSGAVGLVDPDNGLGNAMDNINGYMGSVCIPAAIGSIAGVAGSDFPSQTIVMDMIDDDRSMACLTDNITKAIIDTYTTPCTAQFNDIVVGTTYLKTLVNLTTPMYGLLAGVGNSTEWFDLAGGSIVADCMAAGNDQSSCSIAAGTELSSIGVGMAGFGACMNRTDVAEAIGNAGTEIATCIGTEHGALIAALEKAEALPMINNDAIKVPLKIGQFFGDAYSKYMLMVAEQIDLASAVLNGLSPDDYVEISDSQGDFKQMCRDDFEIDFGVATDAPTAAKLSPASTTLPSALLAGAAAFIAAVLN